MKLKQIAIASMVVMAGSSFAAVTPLPCDTTSLLTQANTCKLDVTFYVAGASALGKATTDVLKAGGYFTGGFIEVEDRGTPNGTTVPNPTNTASAPGNAVTAWYGMSNPALTGGTSKRLLIVYNNYMGSAAGVSNVLSKDMKSVVLVPEAKVVTVGPLFAVGTTASKGYKTNTCVSTTNTSKIACDSWAWTKADVGLSDVDVTELVAMYPNPKLALKDITRVPVMMQGFAIGVNNNFYNALQAHQVSTGALASTCTAGTYTEACQPSISTAQYASLVAKDGGIKSAAGFIPGSTEVLTLARRDDLSGTQAASQIFFNKTGCNFKDPKSKINLGGAMAATTESDTTSSLIVNHNVHSAAVTVDLVKTTGFSIGVLSLASAGATTYKFVKLDGVSPNFAKGGTAVLSSANLRNNMLDGSWPFQVVSYVMYPTVSVGIDPAKAAKKGLIEQFQKDLSDSTLHNLTAISYFNGDAAKQSKVHRANDKVAGATAISYNNCAPLTFK